MDLFVFFCNQPSNLTSNHLSLFLHLLWLKVLLGIIVWSGICGLLEYVDHPFKPFLLLEYPWKSQMLFNRFPFEYLFGLFPFQFLMFFLLFLLCMFVSSIYYVLRRIHFVFQPIWCYLCFLYLDRHLLLCVKMISSMILLEISVERGGACL